MCLLELCAGDDEADEDEDVDGFWCLALGDDVRSRGEFSLLFVLYGLGMGLEKATQSSFSFLVVMVSVVIRVILASPSFFMIVFCFLVIFSETLVINLGPNHRYLFFSWVPLMFLIKKILTCLTYMLTIKERRYIQLIKH